MKRYFPVAIAAALWAVFLSPSFAANVDLGVKTQASPLASAPYTSSDFIALARGTAWDHVLATILNPCSATLAGTVPTPPNDATKFLNGQCAWTVPPGSGGGSWGIVGTSTITGGVTGRVLQDNGGLLGELALGVLATTTPGSGVAAWIAAPSAANFAAALVGPNTVVAGGTGTGSMTANALVKGNGTSAYSPSALSDDGTKLSISEPFDLTSKAIEKEVANAGVTGTTLNKLAKLANGPSTAVITAITDLDGAIGIVTGGAGTTSNARVAFSGQASCVFDGSTTAGDFVIISPSVAGDCRDGGSVRPTGAQTIGRVLSSNGAGGTYTVDLDLGFTNTPGGAGIVISGTTAGTANAQTMAASFSFLDGNVVVAKIGTTNTGATTLNINSTGVKAVAAQDGTGAIGALVGGEFAAGATYTLVAHTSCPAPVSADCYVITTTPGGGATITTSGTVTAPQWDSFTPVVISAAAQTITLPAAPGLSPKGGLPVITKGNSVTLAPNAADGINGGTINTSVTIPANTFTMVSTSGSSGTGAFTVPLGPVAGGGFAITPQTDGTTTFATTLLHNAPADGGSHSYTILSSDLPKEVDLVSTFTAAVVPQATGSFAAGAAFKLCPAGAITATSTTSTINGIAGATGLKLGANGCSDWASDGTNWKVTIGVPTVATQDGTTFLANDGSYAAAGGGTTTWTSYTPTITCSSGTLTTGTASAHYVTNGKITQISQKLTVTTAGTCTYPRLSLPNTANFDAALACVNNNTGASFTGSIRNPIQTVNELFVASPANADIYVCSGVYENT